MTAALSIPKEVKIAWVKGRHNLILNGKGFYISYNPQTGLDGGDVFTMFANTLGADRKDGEETALYVEKTGAWMILEGDFRKEYEAAFPSLAKCKKVYKDNISKRSNWSTV